MLKLKDTPLRFSISLTVEVKRYQMILIANNYMGGQLTWFVAHSEGFILQIFQNLGCSISVSMLLRFDRKYHIILQHQQKTFKIYMKKNPNHYLFKIYMKKKIHNLVSNKLMGYTDQKFPFPPPALNQWRKGKSTKYLVKFVGDDNAKAECEPKRCVDEKEEFSPSFARVMS